MNPQLIETIELVRKAVNSADYACSTKQQYERVLDDIAAELASGEAVKNRLRTGKELLHHLEEGTGLKKRCLFLIDSALENGKVDLALHVGRGLLEPESDEYREIYLNYIYHLQKLEHAQSSIRVEGCLARKYLVFLEAIGCLSIDDVEPDTITGFVVSLRDSWQTTSIGSALSLFRPFIRYLGRTDLIFAAESIKALRKRAILKVLTQEERAAIRNVLDHDDITYRDRAITLLALYTGIRACDIVSLMTSDIDWAHECISIIQSKTQNPLILPLTIDIGNAIFDYMANERPDSTCKKLFLRSRAPFTELKNSSTIYNTIRKVLISADCKIAERQCGTRMLRHSAASAMLASGTALPTIAAVLGHASQASTNAYISVDAEVLARCTLPIVR